MAASCLLRFGTGSRSLLKKTILLQRGFLKQQNLAKVFSTSNSSQQVPEYFRARRGPFTPEEKQHGHSMQASTHWKIERVLAVSMIGIMPAALYLQGPIADNVLAVSVLLHGFWGVNGVLTDYVEKFFPPVHYFWYVLSMLGLAGLFHFNYNDIGVTKAIALVWSM